MVSSERRSVAAVYKALDGMLGIDERPKKLEIASDREFVHTLISDTGIPLFTASMQFAAQPKYGTPPSRRARNRIWTNTNAERGLKSSVYLTLSVAAMLSPEIEPKVPANPLGLARVLTEVECNPPPDVLASIKQIKESIAAQLKTRTVRSMGEVGDGGLPDRLCERGQAAYSYEALRIAGVELEGVSVFGWLTELPTEKWADPKYPDHYIAEHLDTLSAVSGQLAAIWLKAKEQFFELSVSRFDAP